MGMNFLFPAPQWTRPKSRAFGKLIIEIGGFGMFGEFILMFVGIVSCLKRDTFGICDNDLESKIHPG
jgi:hypothetical protein